ncbi:MAG TPA: aminotransferase class IV, partial [Paracoccaceae bacterium]|nr:aminotransferase class IV [Paracoccaceae bacterium]
MAIGSNIRTYHEGTWYQGERAVITSADHGAWLGTTVFDGARLFDGLTPDLEAHCARINRSAASLMLTPSVTTEDMLDIIREGLRAYPRDAAVYIRPMYWGLDGEETGIVPKANSTG